MKAFDNLRPGMKLTVLVVVVAISATAADLGCASLGRHGMTRSRSSPTCRRSTRGARRGARDAGLETGLEAARAADAGCGFAAVASEVRVLAQRSAEAAKEIKGLISGAARQVGMGVKLVGQTGKALRRIVSQVAEASGVVVEIASPAAGQAACLTEVNAAINQMDQVTQQNAALVEQSTAASHALSQREGLATLGASSLTSVSWARETTVANVVLIVDGAPTMRDMLHLALSAAGSVVVQAVDGLHGLELVETGEAPDVIVTDIHKQHMDGFGFIKGVRRSNRHRGTPILVLTTESDQDKKSRTHSGGATGWTVRPFDAANLAGALRRVAA